jgi:hypothetical protein
MWAKFSNLLVWLLCLWVMPAIAETYSAAVPIVNGNVHQARQEALRQILLDAGQTGGVQVSTSSTMVNMELAESVRLQSNFQLNGFKVIRESVQDGSLVLIAEINKQDKPVESCPAPTVRLRNLEYQWVRSGNVLDMETEVLFRLAMKQEVGRYFSGALIEENRKNNASYRLQSGLVGSHSFFGRNLKLRMTFIGPDGMVISQSEFPFEHSNLTEEMVQNIGGAALKQVVLSEQSKKLLVGASVGTAKLFDCFPVIARIPPGGKGLVINTTTDLNPESPPTLIFSRAWPVKEKGQLDMVLLENFVAIKQIDTKQLILDSPSYEAGYLLFQ